MPTSNHHVYTIDEFGNSRLHSRHDTLDKAKYTRKNIIAEGQHKPEAVSVKRCPHPGECEACREKSQKDIYAEFNQSPRNGLLHIETDTLIAILARVEEEALRRWNAGLPIKIEDDGGPYRSSTPIPTFIRLELERRENGRRDT